METEEYATSDEKRDQRVVGPGVSQEATLRTKARSPSHRDQSIHSVPKFLV